MFKANRSLLNPKFEGYKLDPLPQENLVSRFDLEHRPTHAVASGKSPLSFQEVRSRITHNHLAVDKNRGRALYVDSEQKVVLIDVNLETRQPSFRVVYEFPKQISSSFADSFHREYPSGVFLSSSRAIVSDGYGSLYLLDVPDSGPATAFGPFELADNPTPFRIHNAWEVSSTLAVAILSSRHEDKSVKFDVWAVQFTLPFTSSSGAMDVLWRRQGEDVPSYTGYDQSRKAFLLIGSSPYRNPETAAPPSYDPSPDEIAPIPRADENLDAEAPPPYSWTQTSDSVIVAFPLPRDTPKTNIKVRFTPRTLTLHIQGDVSAPIPHYSLQAFWDGISSSSSFWTWDREAEHSFGLLTLHLEKQNEGTRWMQVFAASATSEDVEVPETLDPSELWKIRESLEKYTSALQDGEDASGLGLGRGVPRMAEGEIDEEVDASVGQTAYLTWIDGEGSTPSDAPFNILATTLPGTETLTQLLVIKNNLDGTVHSLVPAADAHDPPSWTHTGTFSALAFVLASKQDTRFTYVVPSRGVLAFENGIQYHGGNVYVYRHSHRSELWAKQAILKVGDGLAGSLLGVGGLTTPEGKIVLLCLCEGQLVIIDDVL